jgi:hypothetical protein
LILSKKKTIIKTKGESMKSFGEILEMADNLPLEEKLMLIEILKKRISESERIRIINDVKDAEKEFNPKDFKTSTVDEIINDILN